MTNNAKSTVIIASILIAILVYGNVNYYDKKRVEINMTTEKTIGNDTKIMMMSDLHLGYHNRKSEFEKWISIIEKENPDLILIAGDIIDISTHPLTEENVSEAFRSIKAPIYACLGNHEYYSGKAKANNFYNDSHINLLKDQTANVGELTIIGRDDKTNKSRKTLKELCEGTDNNRFRIVLDHQPYNLKQAEENGIDLQLSGHTHHGQVWPINWITDMIYECAYGEHQRGNTKYYISSGMGIWGGKFRIGTQSEYAIINIKKK